MWGCGFYHFQGWECRASALREHFGDELTWFGISAVGSSIFVGKATGHGVCYHHHFFDLDQNYFPLNHPRIGLMEHVLDPLWPYGSITSIPDQWSHPEVGCWGSYPNSHRDWKWCKGNPVGWCKRGDQSPGGAEKPTSRPHKDALCGVSFFFFLTAELGNLQ